VADTLALAVELGLMVEVTLMVAETLVLGDVEGVLLGLRLSLAVTDGLALGD
jgi:hypothetical protein